MTFPDLKVKTLYKTSCAQKTLGTMLSATLHMHKLGEQAYSSEDSTVSDMQKKLPETPPEA